jgi:hypothetical protein
MAVHGYREMGKTDLASYWMGTLGGLRVEIFEMITPASGDYVTPRLSRPVGMLVRPTSDAAGALDAARVRLLTLGGTHLVYVDSATACNLGVVVFGF